MPDNSTKTIAATIQRVINERANERTASAAAQQMYGPVTVSKSLDTLLNEVRAAVVQDA